MRDNNLLRLGKRPTSVQRNVIKAKVARMNNLNFAYMLTF